MLAKAADRVDAGRSFEDTTGCLLEVRRSFPVEGGCRAVLSRSFDVPTGCRVEPVVSLVFDCRLKPNLSLDAVVACRAAANRSLVEEAVDKRFGLAVMPVPSLFDSSSVALLSIDATEPRAVCPSVVDVVFVAGFRAVLVVFVVGLLGGLLRLDVVVGAVFVADAAVGLLSRSVSDDGRTVGVVFNGAFAGGFRTELLVVDRRIPGVGSSSSEAWLRDAGRSMSLFAILGSMKGTNMQRSKGSKSKMYQS